MFATSNALTEEQLIKHHENHSNKASQKENNSSAGIKSKDIEYCDLTEKEF